MKKKLSFALSLAGIGLIGVVALTVACSSAVASENTTQAETVLSKTSRKVTQKTKDYWYDKTAELSSYELSQARYGELHKGTAVLVYVTEPFSKSSNTKADEHRKDNVQVLKLNRTKKWLTGIYPYSIMSSTFYPLEDGDASLKVASSLQEWCGMTYLELRNKKKFEIDFNSYFEGFSFQNQQVEKELLEDDLWTLIRLNPELLPVGKVSLIPSMTFFRLRSMDIEVYTADIQKVEEENGVIAYVVDYPLLDRTFTIRYAKEFPHIIQGWEDRHLSGYGEDEKMLTSKAELIKSVKTDYWNKNLNEHSEWREKLGL
ncbi:MAG: septum formation inhibitor Maf [Crocinitomicaceae bacterium]